MLPGSVESASDLAALLSLRNALLEASLLLLDVLSGDLPVDARVN